MRRGLSAIVRAGADRTPRAEWRAFVAALAARVGHRCELPFCQAKTLRLDPHHAPKRRQAGAKNDVDHVILLCRHHHEATDRPRVKGRLVIEPLGSETFRVTRKDVLMVGDRMTEIYQRLRAEAPS